MGKIPTTHFMVLENFDEDKFRLFSMGAGKEEHLKATISILDKNTQSKEIELFVIDAFTPEDLNEGDFKNLDDLLIVDEAEEDIFEEKMSNAGARSDRFFLNYLDSCMWSLVAYFFEGNKKIPIIISHYTGVNITTYSLIYMDDLEEEDMNEEIEKEILFKEKIHLN